MKKTVVITGILGQGASYAADLYLSKGYRVVGVYRRTAHRDLCNVLHNISNPDFILYEGDISDTSSIVDSLKQFQPELYLNFAAQSHVGSSYTQPLITAETDYLAVGRILESIRLYKPDTKFWQASTSERYGNFSETQSIDTPVFPISPYAVAKVASEHLVKMYRYTYKLHASFSIMFNYESPRRSKEFVTRKITDWIGKSFNIAEQLAMKDIAEEKFISIPSAFGKLASQENFQPLRLGNIESFRSWTHCADTIEGVDLQLSQENPIDYVIGLEETHSVKEFLDEAFCAIGIDNWRPYVVFDKSFVRPSDVNKLHPVSTPIQKDLGWKPKHTFKDLVKEMVKFDISINRK